MPRRYIDPRLDPLAAPSARGQHPHTHLSRHENPNPQSMYEHRARMAALARQRPPAPYPQPPLGAVQQKQESLLEHPLVLLGLGALACYALTKMASAEQLNRANLISRSTTTWRGWRRVSVAVGATKVISA